MENNLLIGLIIFFSIIAIIVIYWGIDWEWFKSKNKTKIEDKNTELFNEMKNYKDSFFSLNRNIKRFIFILNIVTWVLAKKDEIKKIIAVVIISIPVWFLLRHIKSLTVNDLYYFYLSALAIGYLFFISFATHKPKTILKSDIVDKKKQELITFYSSNAPANPPKEWEPINLSPRPKQLGFFRDIFGSNSNHKHKTFIAEHYDEENNIFFKAGETPEKPYIKLKPLEIPVGLEKEINDWIKKRDSQCELLEIWKHETEIQKIIQWRFYYAERMANHNLKYHSK